MTKEEIKGKLRELLAEIVEMDVDTIKDDDNFFDDLSFTSITVVQLFVSCQETFGIEMHDNVNMAETVSLNSIADVIDGKLRQTNA